MEQVVPTDAGAAGAALGALLERDDPVTGVCASNDQVAVAVLAGLWTRGLRAPDDLAAIGVGDIPQARVEHALGRTTGAPRPAPHPLHVVVRGSA